MNTIIRRSANLATRNHVFRPLISSLPQFFHTHNGFSQHLKKPHDFESRNVGFCDRRDKIGDLGCGFGGVRGFYTGSVLGKASSAVADVAYEEKAAAEDEGLEIAKLGIAQEIVSSLASRGIHKLFPIQRAVLEPAMQGRDMIGRARTGTGKTLAFGIPVMNKIIQFNAKHGQGKNPLALIMAPTRELANQVNKEFYESAPNLDTLCVYGGTPIYQQISKLNRGVDVLVGTPGRIIDLIKRGALNLSEVRFLVLDEADQMLNVGFKEAVETILQSVPQNRQTMLFSATMPDWIVQLTHNYLRNPLTVDLVGDSVQKLADGITLYSIVSEVQEKPSIIGPLITEHANGGKSIVFTQTKRDAARLAYALQRNFKCEALHGDIAQNQREITLSNFRDGRINVLVATDVAARGLDVPNVDLVIHYELPNSSEIFVHRTGRTGRAGKKGRAIVMHSSQELRDVKGIERDVGCQFSELPRIAVEPGSTVMLNDFGGSFGSSGRMGNRYGSGFGSGSGRSNSFGGNSYSGRMGSPSYGGQSSYGGNRSGGSGHYGGYGSGTSSGYGNQGGSGRVGGFGNQGSSSGFGNQGSSSGFGNQGTSGHFGNFGSSQGGYGNQGSSGGLSGLGSQGGPSFGGFGSSDNTRPSESSKSRFGIFGDDK